MKAAVSDRRQTVRLNIRTPIRVREWKSGLSDQESESENLSESGILFATNATMQVGTILEIFLEMPERITCEPAAKWLCSGHIVRVEPIESAMGKFGVSVQFDCYQVARENGAPANASIPPRQALHAVTAGASGEENRALCLRVIQGLTAKAGE